MHKDKKNQKKNTEKHFVYIFTKHVYTLKIKKSVGI